MLPVAAVWRGLAPLLIDTMSLYSAGNLRLAVRGLKLSLRQVPSGCTVAIVLRGTGTEPQSGLTLRRAPRYKSSRLVCLGSRWEPGTAHATVSAESWSKKATGAKALGRPLWIDNARVRRPTGLSRQLDSTSMGESMGASGQSINLTSLAKKLEGLFPSEG